MENTGKILLLGVGTAGSRAAYYLYQRGQAEHFRILALDSDAEQLSMLPTLPTALLPTPPAIPVGMAKENSRNALEAALSEELSQCHLLVLTTCLGGATGDFYTQEIFELAQNRGIPAVAIAAMPHAFDSEEYQNEAARTLGTLRAQHFEVLSLDCAALGRLFPDASQETAYAQAVRWIAETTIGYLTLFWQPCVTPRKKDNADGKNAAMEFAEMPLGIFATSLPCFWKEVNLDVPTYFREHLEIPEDSDEK